MARPVRRLVTGHDADGRAVCVSDGAAANVHDRPGVAQTNLWRTDATPAPIDGPAETVEGLIPLRPPEGGTVFRIIEFAPEDPEALKHADPRAAFGEIGAADAVVEGARHPMMHRTDTVDYAIVLDGEITMLLDEDEYLLKAGDTVVQRGTNHAWSNRGTEVCRVAFILVDGVRE